MIIYVYPKWHTVSFTVVSQNHLRYLKRMFKIQELDEKDFEKLSEIGHVDTIILHPLFLITGLRYSRLTLARSRCDRLVAFEVADTDRISNKAVDLANQCDLIIVPSTFAKYAYVASGVTAPVEVIPHGISPVYTVDNIKPSSEVIKELRDLKEDKGLVYVLYFLWHSGFRKGADIVYHAFRYIQRRHPTVTLVIKRGAIEDPYMALLRRLNIYEITTWLPEEDLVSLYDTCDVCIVPSRGGGFELNAIEAIARGVITMVPRWGPFIDYLEYTIPIEIEGFEKVFKDNPIHVGYGCRPSLRDFINKFEYVFKNLERLKSVFAITKYEIRREYTWKRVCEKLKEIFDIYDIL